MASETPDPSSSELLTDFDIADVDNWDDQNDSSKDSDVLIKNTSPFIPSTNIHNLQSPLQGHLPGQQLPVKIGLQQPGVSGMDHLKPFQSLLVQRPTLPNQTIATSQQQAVGHEYAKIHNHSQNVPENAKQSLNLPERQAQVTEPPQQKPAQPGQALETLRALALAQEEQARKSKQDQEQAAQIQQQLKLVTNAPQQDEITNLKAPTSPAATVLGIQQPPPAAKPPQVPLTTLKLPIPDSKGQSGKSNSVLQLRGQLVRTPDQKLMLVTELAGKKVGYLLGSQPGQQLSTNPAVASQLIAKANQGIGKIPQKPKHVPSVPSPNSPSQNNVSSDQDRITPEETQTILDSIDENSNDSAKQVFSKESNIAVSSDEDSGSMADVSLGLKNTTLGSPIPSERKKKKVKPKKKKDKNEPAKPISPYLMFFKDTQPSIRQQNPGASLGEASKMVSKLWEQLGKEEKQVYLDRSARAKEEYQVKLAEYKAGLVASATSPVDQSYVPDDSNPSPQANAAGFDIAAVSPIKSGTQDIAGHSSTDGAIVVSSSDSSPEENLKSRLSYSTSNEQPSAVDAELDNSMDVDAPLSDGHQTEAFHSDVSPHVEEPVVRKRGRPKLSKNKKPPLNLPKAKRGRKALKAQTLELEKPPLKLTMKINIKDSKITESPTRAFTDVENNVEKNEYHQEDEDEVMEEKEIENKEIESKEKESKEETEEEETVEIKPSTQPKALLGFKIPKKQRPSTEDVKKENSDLPSKPSQPGFRKCCRPNCEKAAKINKERGPSYCSNKCLVLHCRNVFDTWVDDRKRTVSIE